MGFNPFDPLGVKKKVKKELGRAAKKAGLDDMLAFEKNNLKYMWDALRNDPERAFIGAIDPFSSKMWGEITGKDYEPMLNQLGGPSKGSYMNAAEKGIDVSPSAGAHQVAAAIASWYAGGALAAAAPAAVPVSQAAGAGVVGAGASALDEELDPIDEIDLDVQYSPAPSLRVGQVPGLAEGGEVRKAPWPDSTEAEDAAYSLQAQLWDMEFEGEVVSQGGPQLQGVVEADRARMLPVGTYSVQGLYRPPGAESIMDIGRYGPIADKLRERDIEAPAEDTVAAVGAANASPQIFAHEFGHRRDDQRGGGSERYRLIHDAFRSDTPFEWADAVSRWYSWNRRRWADNDAINTYADVERDLKEQIARSRNSLLSTEVEARESEGDVPLKREGFFNRETLRKDQEEQMERRSHSWSIEKYNQMIQNIKDQGKASGGKVTMPSKSPAQARLMRAAAHGWKKPGGGGPSQSVAREFVNADKGYATGGLAAVQHYPDGGPVYPDVPDTRDDYGPLSEEEQKLLNWKVGGGSIYSKMIRRMQSKLRAKYGLSDPNAPNIETVPISQGPRTGGPRGGGPRGGRGGRGGGGRGGRGGGNTPPRIIPPGVDPVTGLPPADGSTPPPLLVRPPAGRESDHSRQLAEHNARIREMLGGAEGGSVGYAEGGEVDRPGHAEGGNPYPVDSARYKQWERYNHKDPEVAPPPAEVEEEPPSWLERIFAPAADLSTKTERALEEQGEARGGHIKKYAVGGLAAMAPPGRMMPPRGKPMPPPGMRRPPMGGGPRRGMPPRGRPMPMGGGRRGGPPNPYVGGEDPNGGFTGGPKIPSSMQGHLQKMRMMDRPRRGVPGPAGAGGPPGNRVGMQDQQGGLARALQRGTGRPPMSRRSGFPGSR